MSLGPFLYSGKFTRWLGLPWEMTGEGPLVAEEWMRSGAKTNLEGWPPCQVPNENKWKKTSPRINLTWPAWCLGGHGIVALWPPQTETLGQVRTAHVRGCKVFFPITKQENVRSLSEVWAWGQGKPLPLILSLRAKRAPTPREPPLAVPCYLPSLKLFPSTLWEINGGWRRT